MTNTDGDSGDGVADDDDDDNDGDDDGGEGDCNGGIDGRVVAMPVIMKINLTHLILLPCTDHDRQLNP